LLSITAQVAPFAFAGENFGQQLLKIADVETYHEWNGF
jgi:hypothetical protein